MIIFIWIHRSYIIDSEHFIFARYYWRNRSTFCTVDLFQTIKRKIFDRIDWLNVSLNDGLLHWFSSVQLRNHSSMIFNWVSLDVCRDSTQSILLINWNSIRILEKAKETQHDRVLISFDHQLAPIFSEDLSKRSFMISRSLEQYIFFVKHEVQRKIFEYDFDHYQK